MNDFSLQSILFCDDDQSFRNRLLKSADAHNIKAYQASSVDQALQICADKKPDAVVVDLKMPGKSGLHFLKENKDKSVRVIVLTGYGSIQTAIDAVKLGAHNYLTKPVSFKSIIRAINSEACELDLQPYIPSLEEVESEYVNRVLEQNRGNVTKTAKDLGLHRRSLQRKLSVKK